MLEALSQGVRRTDWSSLSQGSWVTLRCGRSRGCQEGKEGPEWGVEPLFLIWLLPLNKSPLTSVPQTPIYKMGESDYLVSENASCPVFLEQKEERQWGRSSGKRTAFTISPSGRGNLATTEVTQFSLKHKPKQASKSIPAYPPLQASSPSVLDL